MILADELDLDWKRSRRLRRRHRFISIGFGQGTGGSQHSRVWGRGQSGAAARKMLVATAAKQWNVEPSACHTENNAVVSGRSESGMVRWWKKRRNAVPQAPSGKTRKITSTLEGDEAD
jgi:isoquinoline 1-oxidoreductase beta subunit